MPHSKLEDADLRLLYALNRDPKEEHKPIHNLRIAVHALVHPCIKSDDLALMLTWLADQLESGQ